MSSSSPRRRQPRVEDSWRMVEGENDSFDTNILPSLGDSPLAPPSSSTGLPTQPFSQDGLSFESQDSIRDFAAHPDDEQVILREPFRPSLSGIDVSASANSAFRTPDPEFRMPRVDIASDGTGSERTIRGLGIGFGGGGEGGAMRRRGNVALGSPPKQRSGRRRYDRDNDDHSHASRQEQTRYRGQLAESFPAFLYSSLLWVLGVIGLAFRYAQRPLAILLAIYLSFGGIIIAQNMATRSISASLSPLCRLPGASFLNIPFCPSRDTIITDPSGQPPAPVEFDDLMTVQAQFEQVLEKSADGVSLPFEMKRSETAIRDLRSLVRHSDLQARDELLLEFDGYVDTARSTASDLQKFNTHVGSAVDAVISINRWTSRYIDTLAPESPDNLSPPSTALVGWTSWLFHPFQPTADHMFNERVLLDKYIEHTALVSERIAALILEAQAILRLLTKAEDHLALIYDITSRSSADTAQRRESVLWTLWTLVGANTARLNSLAQQLALLRQVDVQRSSAVAQVSALILELEAIQAGLGDLRDRVAQPALLQDTTGPAIPLTVHIETIDRGVERLEDARRRIRAAENDRVREALASGGLRDGERMIDAKRN
ncbi:hypothetical protein EDB81DRAFT_389122 [Dactylonectria macrodidyma]|uniref:Uncharacterized protein n=1 Tax=Dactylonectria macrodidyma TaxID=307937 RepID=A0A9P9F9R7_9HYPO|nr:hypothetical protein EDB81DRAFT_389122 [Dactylonectria macrodidyma]